MNNILQKRILELSYQNNLLREEIEKIKKNLNEGSYGRSNLSREKREELAAELAHEDHPDFPNRGYSSRAYQDRPIRDLESENTRWHAANVSPLIQKHGLGDHASKLDQHGVPHAEHMSEVRQHANFGSYMRDLKAAHEVGFEESKRKNRSGKGSRWHVEAFGKIRGLSGR